MGAGRRGFFLCLTLIAASHLLGGCEAADPESWADPSGCAVQLAPADGVLLVLEELGPPVLGALDLATGQTSTVFSVPSGGFAYEFDARPEGVVLAYTAPAAEGEAGYDRSTLVLLADGALAPLLGDANPGDWAFHPKWSADGAAIWFVRSGEATAARSVLTRLDLAKRRSIDVVDDATEPAVSPDGAHLAWVAVDPVTATRTLVLADADGGSPRIVADAAEIGDLGLPFFSADGRWLYFTVLLATVPEPTPTLLDLLIPSANAHASHDQVGDWWRVSVDGGAPERASFEETVQYDGAPSPDGALVAATRDGVVRVDPATGEVARLSCLRTVRAVGLVGEVPTHVR